jgi:hypothetical protein
MIGPLALPGVRGGFVVTDNAASTRPEPSMMAEIVPCHPAYNRAFEATFGGGRSRSQRRGCHRYSKSCKDHNRSHPALLERVYNSLSTAIANQVFPITGAFDPN